MHKKEIQMGTLWAIYLIALFFIIFYFVLYKPKVDELKRLQRNQAYIDNTYLRKCGGTSTYQNKALYNGKYALDYDLRSWDGGKNWYAIDYDLKTEEFKILGVADSIYPKLLEHLQALDDLENYAKKNGAIDGTKKEGIEKLEKAGFKVVTKTN